MNQKKVKKLHLKKFTIANLDRGYLAGIKGGGFTDPISVCFCPTQQGTICQPTAQCPTDPTNLSACDCVSVDLACPTDAC